MNWSVHVMQNLYVVPKSIPMQTPFILSFPFGLSLVDPPLREKQRSISFDSLSGEFLLRNQPREFPNRPDDAQAIEIKAIK